MKETSFCAFDMMGGRAKTRNGHTQIRKAKAKRETGSKEIIEIGSYHTTSHKRFNDYRRGYLNAGARPGVDKPM